MTDKTKKATKAKKPEFEDVVSALLKVDPTGIVGSSAKPKKVTRKKAAPRKKKG